MTYPITTLTINPAAPVPSVKARMPLILAQGASSGNFTSGQLVSNISNDLNAGNDLCGKGSMGALMINEFKAKNPFIQLDAIIVDDNGDGVAAAGSIAMAASSPKAGTFILNVGSKSLSTYEIATTAASTPTTIGASIEDAINGDDNSPVTASNSSGTVTLTAKNKGTCGNNINIHIGKMPSGVSATVTAFTNGATNPVLTGILDKISDKRYDIIAPVEFVQQIKAHLEDKFNVSNKNLDGLGFVAKTDTYANHQTALAPATLASKTITYFCNKLVNDADHKGGAIEELDYVISSSCAALRALRLIPDSLIGKFMQGITRGGLFTAGIPYHGMKLLGFAPMEAGKNFKELEIDGLAKLGGSTFSIDDAGQFNETNPFNLTCFKEATPTSEGFTFRNVNKSDCSTISREFIFTNIKAKYKQSGLTDGNIPIDSSSEAVYATAAAIKADIFSYYKDLANIGILRSSAEIDALVLNSIIVNVNTQTGLVSGSFELPVMGQLEKIDFNINIKI